MKKIILILSFIFLITPFYTVRAISGTCSWHGGINCGVGSDWDGSVICVDGWRDSSERYYEAEGCKGDSGRCQPTINYTKESYTNWIAFLNEQKKSIERDLEECKFGFLGLYDDCMNTALEDYNKSVESYKRMGNSNFEGLKKMREEFERTCQVNRDAGYAQCALGYTNIIHDIEFCIKFSYYDPSYEQYLNYLNSLPKEEPCKDYTLDNRRFYTKNNKVYYDYACKTERDLNLEKEIEDAYKSKCQEYTPNNLIIYNIILGNIDKTKWLTDLSNNCAQEANPQPKVLGATSSLFLNREETLVKKVDEKLVNKLKGYILLQVQEHGEDWYVDPATGKKYYTQDGPTAYEIMRKLGIGITDADLAKIPTEGSKNKGDQKLINRVKGKILLQVQQHGEAWYVNPKDGKRYYLKDGNEAYRIMRILSLGITNTDLRKITVGRIEDIKK